MFNVPFCLLPDEALDEMLNASAIISGCQVRSKSGMLFNVKGELVTCNHLLDFPVCDYETIRALITQNQLGDLWEYGKVDEISAATCVYRADKCKNCKYWDLCGGGCPIFWTYYNPLEVIQGVNLIN